MGLNMGYFSKMTNMSKFEKRSCDVTNDVIIINHNLYERPWSKFVKKKNSKLHLFTWWRARAD